MSRVNQAGREVANQTEAQGYGASCNSAEWEVIVPNSEYVSANEFSKPDVSALGPEIAESPVLISNPPPSHTLLWSICESLHGMCISVSQKINTAHVAYQTTHLHLYYMHIMAPTGDVDLQHNTIYLFFFLFKTNQPVANK